MRQIALLLCLIAPAGAVNRAPTPVPEIKADLSRALDHLAATPLRRENISDRLDDMIARGGIPVKVRDGLFRSHVETQELAPELVSLVLPKMRDASRAVENGPLGEQWGSRVQHRTHAFSDMLYSVGKLMERSGSAEELVKQLDWLWSTYDLTGRRGLR